MSVTVKSIVDYLSTRKDEIAVRIVEKQYKLQFGTWAPYGEEGKKVSIRDAGYHLPFLAEAITSDEEKMFVEYVEWVKLLFANLNLPDNTMLKTLECTQAVFEEDLPPALATITGRFIQAGINQLNQPLSHIDSYIDEHSKYGLLAKDFNNALLNGNKNLAGNLVMDAVKQGVPIKDIYLEVFQKSQYEVGRLWLSNQISVAKEHFCSAATQMIMSQLYPYIFATERSGYRFVGACIGGELHEIGIRMVSDFFEMEGWDTYYMGANAPASSIIHAVEENNAQLVGLSIAMPYHRRLLSDTISEIKKQTNGLNLKIIVGGIALNGSSNNWLSLGADAYAPDAQQAIIEAKKLILS